MVSCTMKILPLDELPLAHKRIKKNRKDTGRREALKVNK